jgi:hypothetical protein
LLRLYKYVIILFVKHTLFISLPIMEKSNGPSELDEEQLQAEKATRAKDSTSRVRMRVQADTTSAARKVLDGGRSRAA